MNSYACWQSPNEIAHTTQGYCVDITKCGNSGKVCNITLCMTTSLAIMGFKQLILKYKFTFYF